MGGTRTADGARSPLLGVLGADFVELTEGIFPVLFRVLATGKAGSAMFGGPLEGRDGRGRVVAIVVCCGADEIRKAASASENMGCGSKDHPSSINESAERKSEVLLYISLRSEGCPKAAFG